MQASNYWPTPSAHQEYWERFNNPYVYTYDPTEDGPETVLLRRIKYSHTPEELVEERAASIARHIGRIWSRYHL